MPCCENPLINSQAFPYSVAGVKEKVWVAFDQHGTYREPLPGVGVRCIQKPLSDELADFFLDLVLKKDLNKLLKIAESSVVMFHRLPVSGIEFPMVDDSESEEFQASTLNYSTRPEQEEGLQRLAQSPDVSCTMISGMPAANLDWAWWGLGETGRRSVDPDLQIILRQGANPFVSKLFSLISIMYSFDQPLEDNEGMEPRKVFLVDDDLNFACTASRLLQIPVLVPIRMDQEGNYPLLPIPRTLQKEYEEVYVGAGLPELNEYLSEYLKGGIPEGRFNAYRFQGGNSVELLKGLTLEDFLSEPSFNRAY